MDKTIVKVERGIVKSISNGSAVIVFDDGKQMSVIYHNPDIIEGQRIVYTTSSYTRPATEEEIRQHLVWEDEFISEIIETENNIYDEQYYDKQMNTDKSL